MNKYESLSKMKISIFLSAFFVGISFFTERLFFDVNLLNIHNKLYILLKLLLLFIYLTFFQVVFHVINKVKQGDEAYVFALKIFTAYFLLMFVLLLFTWPGIWRDDEFHIISGVKTFHMNCYQHYITAMVYMLFLMIIPCAGGIILLLQVFYSSIVAYFAYNLYSEFQLSKKKIMFCLFPFIFFPVLDSNLYPVRLSIYAFLESFFIMQIIVGRKKGYINNIGNILYIIISVLLAVWRTEGIYYIIVAIFLYCICFKNKWKKKVIITFCILCLSLYGRQVQDRLAQKQIGDQGFIISTLNFIYDGIKNEWIEQEQYAALEKVLNMQVLEENGPGAVWGDCGLIRVGYSKDEFKMFKKAYVIYSLKNFKSFFNTSLQRYIYTNAVGNKNIFITNSAELFDENNDTPVRIEFKEGAFNKPIFVKLRSMTINLFESKGNSKISYIVRIVLYNSFVPIILLIACIVLLFAKRQYMYAVVLGILLIKIPLIFFTSPSILYMYYYPISLQGYLSWFIYVAIKNRIPREVKD